jgi:hypothetical protein
MPFLSYKKLSDIENTPQVSTGSCASLVMYFTRVGVAALWKEGDHVRDNKTIKRGTAIATFVDGKYPNNEHDNHAALYVSQDAGGIQVLDQWSSKKTITTRTMSFQGKAKDGTYIDPSNNGDAMSIIEH